MEAKTKQEDKPHSTTERMTISHVDDSDVLLIKLDAKDPIRPKVMAALQGALEQAQPPRDEEASRARAYAQEKLPDDWKRKHSDKPEERTYRHPGEQPKTAEKVEK